MYPPKKKKQKKTLFTLRMVYESQSYCVYSSGLFTFLWSHICIVLKSSKITVQLYLLPINNNKCTCILLEDIS